MFSKLIPLLYLLARLNLARISFRLMTIKKTNQLDEVIANQLTPLKDSFFIQILNPNPYLFWSTVGLSQFVTILNTQGTPAVIGFVFSFLSCVYATKYLFIKCLDPLLKGRFRNSLDRACGVCFAGFSLVYFSKALL